MKRTTLAAACAAALVLPVSTALLAACPADGATAFLAGPVNPNNGFAEYVTDSNNVSLELCLSGDPTGAVQVCFFDAAIPGVPFSEQIGFGPEAFWWLAEGAVDTTATDPVNGDTFSALVVMAAEAAFLTEVPADGDQFPFTRLRIRINAPVPGIYTITHPFGQSLFVVPADAITAGQEIRESFDIQFVPAPQGGVPIQNQGRVGPWLTQVGGPFTFPEFPGASFIGTGDVGPVAGSPCNTNFVRVSVASIDGVSPPPVIDPQDIDGDGNTSSVSTTDFTVHGKLYDGRVATGLISERTTYDRGPGLPGQVEAFAASSPTAGVSVSGGPSLPAGDLQMATDGTGSFFRSEPVGDASILPPTVDVKAVETTGATDPTRLVRLLTDVVRITRAEYNLDTGILLVEANSSDAAVTPTLTVAQYQRPVGTGITTAAPPATVHVISSAGGSDTEQVRVVSNPAQANRPPVAIPDSANVLEDVPTDIAVLANDLDPDGDPIQVLAIANVTSGTAVATATGVRFTGAQNYNGPAGFTYTISDGRGGVSGSATVSITVVAVNDPPFAGGDTVTTAEDTPVTIAVLGNDGDVDGNALTITAVTQPVGGGGTVTNNGNSLSFTPALNFNGARSFTYTVSDGSLTATATVNVTVTPVNDAPVAVANTVTTAAGTAVSIPVLTNDTDVDGPLPLALASVTQPATGGSVAISGTSAVFTPAAGFAGTTSFTYRAADALGALSAPGTVTVTVAPAVVVDLDIAALVPTLAVRRGRPISIRLDVRNAGTVNQARIATLVGRRLAGGVEVYRRTLSVSDPVAGGTTSFNFPTYTPVVADVGTIVWTATIADDDPDVDQATAATVVQ
jgi:hypothetical protein